jgi:hypothetical protein
MNFKIAKCMMCELHGILSMTDADKTGNIPIDMNNIVASVLEQ